MSYRGELRSEVRSLAQSIAAMSDRESQEFTGPFLQPERDALRNRYVLLFERINTILDIEEDDPPDEAKYRELEALEELRATIRTMYCELPNRGPLRYAVLQEHLEELRRLRLMSTEVFECVRERIEQESRPRGA